VGKNDVTRFKLFLLPIWRDEHKNYATSTSWLELFLA